MRCRPYPGHLLEAVRTRAVLARSRARPSAPIRPRSGSNVATIRGTVTTEDEGIYPADTGKSPEPPERGRPPHTRSRRAHATRRRECADICPSRGTVSPVGMSVEGARCPAFPLRPAVVAARGSVLRWPYSPGTQRGLACRVRGEWCSSGTGPAGPRRSHRSRLRGLRRRASLCAATLRGRARCGLPGVGVRHLWCRGADRAGASAPEPGAHPAVPWARGCRGARGGRYGAGGGGVDWGPGASRA